MKYFEVDFHEINVTNYICICKSIKYSLSIAKAQTHPRNISEIPKNPIYSCQMFFARIREESTNNFNSMSDIKSCAHHRRNQSLTIPT